MTAKERMETVDAALDEYESTHGLPALCAPGTENELNEYLTMPRNMLEKLTSEACGHISYRLSQYAFYLQRLYNREQARITWAKDRLNREISSQYGSYDRFTKHEARIAMIIKENQYADSLNSIIVYATQRSNRLEQLSQELRNLSNVLKSLSFNKKDG